MGYDDTPDNEAQRLGQSIYQEALSDRRGFRPDQIGIPYDDDVWGEIFEHIGEAVASALNGEKIDGNL